jgi:dihydrofolate reductase
MIGEYWAKVDTMLMGRKTYEVALRSEQGMEAYGQGIKTYIFSRTLKPTVDQPGVEFVSGDAVEFVRKLKQSPGKEICLMGGGELAKPLFEAGLIDEVGMNIHPIMLGTGIPLFHPMSRQTELELINSRTFQNGCVVVTYRVRH